MYVRWYPVIGPFRSEQGNSSHETVIDVAVTDEKVILVTDEEGAIKILQ